VVYGRSFGTKLITLNDLVKHNDADARYLSGSWASCQHIVLH